MKMKFKLSLDKNTIKEFLLDHAEKFVFGVIFLAFVGLVFGAASRQRYDREPPELANTADEADRFIDSRPADPGVVARDYRAMIENNRPPRTEDYQHKASWNPRLQNPMELPGRPPILLVKELRGSTGRGAFRMDTSRERSTTHRAASGGTERGLHGQRWVVVTGAVPLKEQQRAWDEYFRDKFRPRLAQYTPEFIYYRVERAEVPADGDMTELQWQPLDLRKVRNIVASWQGSGKEVVDPEYTHPVLTYPLGPLQQEEATPFGGYGEGRRGSGQSSAWGDDVAHPKIPVKQLDFEAEADLLQGNADAVDQEAQPEPADPLGDDVGGGGLFGGTDRSLDPYSRSRRRDTREPREPGLEEGYTGRDAEEEIEFLLFRYFDFDVEPGKTYRYRVRLILANPFEGVEPRYLAPEAAELSSKSYIEGERWSDPTGAVTVPRDTHILALGVRRSSRRTAEPNGEVAIVKWQQEDGSEVTKAFRSVLRGQLLDYPDTRLHDVTSVRRDRDYEENEDDARRLPGGEAVAEAEPEKVDFITHSVAVDMQGGARLPGRDRTLNEPGYILLMTSDGSLEMRSEMEDRVEYEGRTASDDPVGEDELFPGEGAPPADYGGLEEMMMEEGFGRPSRGRNRRDNYDPSGS